MTYPADPADEHTHPNDRSHYWTETCYWGWSDTASGLNGWIYVYARPVLGVVAAGVWVYGGTNSHVPHEQPYHRHHFHLPFTENDDFAKLSLASGLSVTCIKPFGLHTISYQDGDEISLELVFKERSPARSLMPPGGDHGHIDQLLTVSGTVTLPEYGLIAVDGVGARDRSWSVRSDLEGTWRNHKDDYAWGVTPGGASFLSAVVLDELGAAMFSFGHLIDVGRPGVRTITSVHRNVAERSPAGLPLVIALELTDDTGSTVHVDGHVESTVLLTTFPGLQTAASRVRWSIDGHEFHGEDQEKWPSRLLSPIGKAMNSPAGGPTNDWMLRPLSSTTSRSRV